MAEREAHLVGSLPGPTPAAAMATALEILGPRLRSLPDGETGSRRNWIISIVDGLRAHPDLELRKEGDWSDYDRTPQLRVRKGRRLYGAALDFGHVAAVRESLPAFREVAAAAGRADLSFQEGVPGDFDLAMFTLGPAGALRNRRAFTEASLAEIRDVAALAGPSTVFQIEVPVELVLLAKAPAAARPALARVLARGVGALAAGTAEGTRFAVHLCLGDMNNRAFGTMTDVSPLVLLANAVQASWPAGRPLELLHAPFAAADSPATTDPAFYAPLAGLHLPAEVRFAAGFAHEAQALEDQRRIRTMIDDHLGRRGRHLLRVRPRPTARARRPRRPGAHRRALRRLTGRRTAPRGHRGLDRSSRGLGVVRRPTPLLSVAAVITPSSWLSRRWNHRCPARQPSMEFQPSGGSLAGVNRSSRTRGPDRTP